MANIIIYGGSFDPIHNGHIKIALEAHEKYDAKVIFVPSKYPRWKEPSAKAIHRLNMLKLALKPYANFFTIDTYELDNEQDPNYTIDTLKYYVNQFPNDQLFLLIGEDQVDKFHEWKDANKISELVQIVYYGRNDANHENASKNILKYHMEKLDGDLSNTSSTDIRNMKSIDTPLVVLKYIMDKNLYFAKQVRSYYSSARYEHVCSTAETAYLIAMVNESIDVYKTFIAAYLHDLGKDASKILYDECMEGEFSRFENLPPYCLHQFVGRYIAEHDFDIEDEDILDAIEYHCTGKAHMSNVAKVVYASDKIEPTRGYNSQDLMNVCMKDIESGFITVLRENKKYIDSKKQKNEKNFLSEECFNYYLKDN